MHEYCLYHVVFFLFFFVFLRSMFVSDEKKSIEGECMLYMYFNDCVKLCSV